MQISEKELEDFIFEDLIQNYGMGLSARGFQTYYNDCFTKSIHCKCKWLRQFDLGPYGRLDVVGYFRNEGIVNIELLELKAVSLKSDDIDQIFRYGHAILEHVSERDMEVRLRMYLIGTSIESGHYIHNRSKGLSMVEYEYNLRGVSFNQHSGDWHRSSDTYDFRKTLRNAEEIHGY